MSVDIRNNIQALRSSGNTLLAEALDLVQQDLDSLDTSVTALSTSGTPSPTTLASLFPIDGLFLMMQHPVGGPGPFVNWICNATGATLEVTGSLGVSSAEIDSTSSSSRILLFTSANQTEVRNDGFTLTGTSSILTGLQDSIIVTTSGGNLIWGLKQTSNNGQLNLATGAGSGGFDGLGSTVQLDATSGSVTCVNLALGSLGGNRAFGGADFIYSLHSNTLNHYLWALHQVSNIGVLIVSNGSGTQGWDSLGAGFQVDGNGVLFTNLMTIGNSFPIAGNQVNIGPDYANSLLGGVSGKVLWALAQSSSKGIMRISDGSGSGGIDGAGAYVYVDGINLKANSIIVTSGGGLDLTGASLRAPNGILGLPAAATVRNAAGTGTSTLTFSGGILTAYAP